MGIACVPRQKPQSMLTAFMRIKVQVITRCIRPGLHADMLDLQDPCFEGLSLKIWTFLCEEAAAVGQCSRNTQA